ncbi:Uncharacterised protein [Mycobacteroides abscessus subsp. abscessus]|nr:Uncharacterised protein [Mycobacteroides abscessus subsp. abscessus]
MQTGSLTASAKPSGPQSKTQDYPRAKTYWMHRTRTNNDSSPHWRHPHIGGHPRFIQEDVRGTGNYAAIKDPASSVLLSIGGGDLCDWWSGGTASLFGDPRALAAADLTSIRYHTDR